MPHRLPDTSGALPAGETGWTVRAASLSQLADIAPLALASATEQRKTLVLSLLADLLRRSASGDLFLAEIRAGEQSIAAAIAVRTAIDSASLVAVDAIPLEREDERFGQLRGQLAGHLLRHLHQRLAEAGVTFVQAMREPDADQPMLTACGYEFLATLDYMVAARGEFLPADRPIRWAPYERFFEDSPVDDRSLSSSEALIALIDATYCGSLDCPAMERFRSAAALVDTYRQSPLHDPQAWQVLID